jgi:hypothetical protein
VLEPDDFTLSSYALAVAEREGLTPADVCALARRSAQFSHPIANRRCGTEYLLLIQGPDDPVPHIALFGRVGRDFDGAANSKTRFIESLSTSVFAVQEECEDCGGTGCDKCHEGLVFLIRSTEPVDAAPRRR